MIVSVKKGKMLYGPTAIMNAFTAKKNTKDTLLMELDDAMMLKDSLSIHITRMRINSVDKDMLVIEEKMKLTMRNLARRYSRLHIDGDCVVWTSPPVEIG